MKKIISLTLVALMGLATINAAENVLDGKFKVAANKYVKFTKSNLNYNGTTKRFEIISSQYETRGSFNENLSSTYTGLWDLFGWGTSKYNNYNPWLASDNNSDYPPVPQYTNLASNNNYKQYDWGTNNTINGELAGTYYCLNEQEWEYLLFKRPNADKLRGMATISMAGSPKGVILLPDNWSTPFDIKFDPTAAEYNVNVYSVAQWKILEANGAVFLPVAGIRMGTSYEAVNFGAYWTSTSGRGEATTAYAVLLDNQPEVTMRDRFVGLAVRLVDATPHSLNTVYSEETMEDPTLTEYEWNGYKLTKSGDYTYTYLEVRENTDSIVTLHLKMIDAAINNTPATKKSNVSKLVRDGQLYIIRDDKTFNAAGQQVK